ncbi:MAG: glutathione S-transferase family protein [Alphaproteobacteria bacterium]|nr:MAG: glutathione S-transferase family protein [Alphaproteobacteria bacterium]
MSIAAGPDCWRRSSSGSRRRDTDAAQFPCKVNLDLTTQERSMTELYVFPPSPRAFKVMAFANYLGIEPTLHMLDLIKGEQKSPQYAALNPNMRMPTLKEGDYVLWESNAILQYLAAKRPQTGLLPADEKARLDVTRWQFWDLAKVLDGQLKEKKFVTGDTLTIADFSLGAPMNLAEMARLPVEPYREINRWYATLRALPAWQKTLAQCAVPAAAAA